MNLISLALLPSLILSTPPPITRRISVLLVPLDRGAEASALKLETYMEEAAAQHPHYLLTRGGDLFETPPDRQAEASLRLAQAGFEEGRAAFETRANDEAERKLRGTIKEYAKAAAAMKGCGNLCDAMAMYSAVLHARGEVEEAKMILLDLFSLGPDHPLDRKMYSQDFLAFRAQVQKGRSAQLRGALNLKSKPSGARVYLGGQFQGYSPLSLHTLAVGKHLLRLERPGHQLFGMMVSVSPEEQEVGTELSPTPAFKAYDAVLDKLSAEVARGKGGPTMASIAKKLNLDRGLVGTLKEVNESGGLELRVGVFDLKSGARLSGKKSLLQGDEFGQLQAEVGRLVHRLLEEATSVRERVVKASDPLENRQGTEEWNLEGRDSRSSERPKKRSKDPLESVSGTEDW